MPPKKGTKKRKIEETCPEEITEEERLEALGIYKEDEDEQDETWRDVG